MKPLKTVPCRWWEDEYGHFETECGECFVPHGGDDGRWARYCCWCGRQIQFVEYGDECGRQAYLTDDGNETEAE